MDTAFVLVNCDLGAEEEVLVELKHIDSVKEVCGTFGAYDVIAKIEDSDRDKVRDTITWNIRKIPHVRSTLTLVGIPGQS
ncbi:Lrp/AsnC ligand binding domain-containing protein [Nitrosopumilus piranensis]|uniref:AsnC family transcriptional regulator n=1 Tax=Nitrosopumilus piranensis TaxID=1582439 RepID=A0A0C5CD14_9ARCH|nr:Lrp/AsnC ligand binding domain-containing protein [Nitrosopumilus piranensis]AJM93072.1 AsnC family transcriptional regulator [Nitrosopumilus piranensis]